MPLLFLMSFSPFIQTICLAVRTVSLRGVASIHVSHGMIKKDSWTFALK
jgi:hypothetical protein